MLLTITTTNQPATDLGYLLHKNPSRPQTKALASGTALVFYPEVSEERCTAALLLEVDPIGLVRGRGATLSQYVNDRPYAASSLLSVALAQLFGTAMNGRSKERPELAQTAIPIEARLSALPCTGGEAFLRRLFEPLGYEVEAVRHGLDAAFPEWGESRYYTVTIRGVQRLCDLLTHLYVLVPVLDDGKHYWVGDDEVEKLLAKGKGWLEEHPEREAIANRYLKRQRGLTRLALSRLVDDEAESPDEKAAQQGVAERDLERPLRLNDLRISRVTEELLGSGARSVVDLGCGEGRLLRELIRNGQFERVVGVDVSPRALDIVARRLHVDEMTDRQRERVTLLQASLTYRDPRLEGFDAAALVEVIEHVDLDRLDALERAVFEFARPGTVVVTTPNAEYNVHFEALAGGEMRHADHRFEWTREQFRQWCDGVTSRFGYDVRLDDIGEAHRDTGAPTQMGVFRRGG